MFIKRLLNCFLKEENQKNVVIGKSILCLNKNGMSKKCG